MTPNGSAAVDLLSPYMKSKKPHVTPTYSFEALELLDTYRRRKVHTKERMHKYHIKNRKKLIQRAAIWNKEHKENRRAYW